MIKFIKDFFNLLIKDFLCVPTGNDDGDISLSPSNNEPVRFDAWPYIKEPGEDFLH